MITTILLVIYAAALDCPAGKSCDRIAGTMTDCEDGTYSPYGYDDCVLPPMGYWPNAEKDGVVKCNVDKPYSNPPTENCRYCPEGWECMGGIFLRCPAGKYSILGDLACQDCPAGSICPEGKVPSLCPGTNIADKRQ